MKTIRVTILVVSGLVLIVLGVAIVDVFMGHQVHLTLFVLAVLASIGLMTAWVLQAGLVPRRLHLITPLAMTGWTMFVALRFAWREDRLAPLGAYFTPKATAMVWDDISRACAIWLAGIAPAFLLFVLTYRRGREPAYNVEQSPDR